jgi:O-acetyl-ADP-ribose deacetylase (regulator of RNase III)
MDECMRIGGCITGGAVITNAGNLLAKKIIHTPGPVWHGGDHGEAENLRNCYINSFNLAKENGLKTIAFPAISTGIYGYPIEQATWIAIEEGIRFSNDFDEIRYVCFSENNYKVYQKVYRELRGE